VEIFERMHINGMAFDVEALHLARRMSFDVKEISVPWKQDPDSRVRLFDDSFEMLGDVLWLYAAWGRNVSIVTP
jgi:hypothetical protein